MHCSIALALTAIYFALAGPISKVTGNWFLPGFLYGLGIWIFINHFLFVAVGIKSSHTALPPWPGLLNGVAAHIFLVGIPIAFGAASCADEGRHGCVALQPDLTSTDDCVSPATPAAASHRAWDISSSAP